MWKSIAIFSIRALMVAIPPLAIAVGLYVWADPFAIYTSDIKEMYPTQGKPGSNKGYLGLRTIMDGKDKYGYDSFILGSSVSIAYSAEEWTTYLSKGASAVHFDSSNEGAGSLRRKVDWLKSNSIPLRNALIVLSPRVLEAPITGDYVPYVDAPELTSNILETWKWHYSYFKAFTSRDFYASYLPYLIDGQPKERTSSWVFEKQPIVYDPIRNEEKVPEWEKMIDTDPERFYKEHRISINQSMHAHCSNAKRLTPERIAEYEKVVRTFRELGTDYRVIIGPELQCDTLSRRDKEILERVFGKDKVYDYSAPSSGLTKTITDFIDDRHYRPGLAKEMMRRTYLKDK